MKISIVVPCFNEEEALPLFVEQMDAIATRTEADLELLLIDDGSTDGTLAYMRTLADARSDVRALSFSRNYGKEAALLAGLTHATGDLVAVMDADLQDPPELLLTMLQTLRENGCDCVAARRVTRAGEPPVRSWFARGFYRLMRYLSTVPVEDGVRDFRLMTRQMADAILSLPEKRRFSKSLFAWVGFDVCYIEYENVPRLAGVTKWSFWGLVKYALEGVFWVTTSPLAASFVFAVLTLLAALVLFLLGLSIAGLMCVLSALVLTGIGVFGLYLTRIYWEVKRRPLYVLREEDPA